MDKGKITIIIASADSYNDIFNTFVYFLKMNWKKCPYRIIYSNEVLDANYEGIETIHSGIGSSWSTRAKNALKLVTTEYVLLLCDDLFIVDPVAQDDIDTFFSFLITNNITYCRLLPLSDSDLLYSKPFSLYNLGKKRIYGVNLMAGLFNRDFMETVIKEDNLTGWQIERMQNDIARNAEEGFYEDKLLCNKNYLNLLHCVQKGKWIRKSKKILEKKMGKKWIITNRKTESFFDEKKTQIKGYISRKLNMSLHH